MEWFEDAGVFDGIDGVADFSVVFKFVPLKKKHNRENSKEDIKDNHDSPHC